jgi:hypothetical protein
MYTRDSETAAVLRKFLSSFVVVVKRAHCSISSRSVHSTCCIV